MNARAARLAVALVASGEMAVGVVLAAYPSIGVLLIGAPLDDAGLLVARMMGVAVFAIGLTWWLGRNGSALVTVLVPGFIIYNLGVGALFALAASAASQPLVPWVLAIVHLASGTTCGALVATAPLLRHRSP